MYTVHKGLTSLQNVSENCEYTVLYLSLSLSFSLVAYPFFMLKDKWFKSTL